MSAVATLAGWPSRGGAHTLSGMLRRALIAVGLVIVGLTVIGLLLSDEDEDCCPPDPLASSTEGRGEEPPSGFGLLARAARPEDELPSNLNPALPETGEGLLPVDPRTARRSRGSREGVEAWAAGDEETVCLLVGGISAGGSCLSTDDALRRGILAARGAGDDPPASVEAGSAVYVALVPDGVSSVDFELDGRSHRAPVRDNLAILIGSAGRVILSWRGPEGPAERTTTATF